MGFLQCEIIIRRMSASSEGVLWFTATCGEYYMENAGTCACWICIRVKSIMYSRLVMMVSVAVRILVIFIRKSFRV